MSQRHEFNPHFLSRERQQKLQQQLQQQQQRQQQRQQQQRHQQQQQQEQQQMHQQQQQQQEQQQMHQQQQMQPPQHPHGFRIPQPRRTNPITWFIGAFCAIFWIIVIVGGIVVLIVYLLFRPRSPRFDISGATLNAAYLDMGYLLNADLAVLTNFTNTNEKVSVDFSYMVLDLYYGSTLIATQPVDPFSAARSESKLVYVHMVTSQVRLSSRDIRRMQKDAERNRIMFEVKGYFRTRSRLGGFFRYSYWLYAKCSVVVTNPPFGIFVSSKCRTKR